MPVVTLSIGTMRCRRCVREVTGWLRDVAGVDTVVADATAGTVVLVGTMVIADVLAVFAGSDYVPELVATAPAAES